LSLRPTPPPARDTSPATDRHAAEGTGGGGSTGDEASSAAPSLLLPLPLLLPLLWLGVVVVLLWLWLGVVVVLVVLVLLVLLLLLLVLLLGVVVVLLLHARSAATIATCSGCKVPKNLAPHTFATAPSSCPAPCVESTCSRLPAAAPVVWTWVQLSRTPLAVTA
jgi:hypothetical protein